MLRYVILKHSWEGIHYDLMLECPRPAKNYLKTWKLAESLSAGPQEALELADHRMEYLTYEGEVGGNRGSVVRIAAGHYTVIEEKDRFWHIKLEGSLCGTLKLSKDKEAIWQLEWQVAGSETMP